MNAPKHPDTRSHTGVDFGADEAAMQQYQAEGLARAMALGNRGPIRFIGNGALHPDIVEAYWRCGFYVFEGVLKPDELADIEADVNDMRSRFPAQQGLTVDAQGRPALGAESRAPNLFWAKPLGDPFGGTSAAAGRHPVKMSEPKAGANAPDEIVYLMLGTLQHSDALLRVYGHPDILGVAAAINGRDFVPFNEALFLKEPGLGASVAWHRDGVTHWDAPDWDQGTHGFNFMAQLYGCTPANGVWVLPGTHKLNKVDIAAMYAEAGSDRLPDAVPMVCAPGDVVISNRQVVHGSFANTSPDWRVTVNFGFHRRGSVLDVMAGGIHNERAVYDDARITRRARMIGYGIDARSQRFPDEQPFVYQPHAESGATWAWNDEARATVHDYNLEDLSI